MGDVVMAFEFPASRDGKNGYTFRCDPLGRWTGYSLCQHVIQAYMEKRLKGAFEDCRQCITKKECPAIKMIAEEKKAGKVLYWQDRHAPFIPALTTPPNIDKDIPGERERIEASQAGDSRYARAKFMAAAGIPANYLQPPAERKSGWWKAHMTEADLERGRELLEEQELRLAGKKPSKRGKAARKKPERLVDPLGDAPSYGDVVSKIAEKEAAA